jgi:RelA/SpoT family (p)ppGpp synthetase
MEHDGLKHPLTIEALARLVAITSERGLSADTCTHTATWAAERHRGQWRKSGEPYVTHCIEVAILVTDMGGSAPMVQAALLHDTVEDTPTTLADISEEFGDDVSRIVDGCTKVALVHPDAGTAERQAANLRKLFLSLADDPRVVLVKLCDRLHNLRTIAALPPEKARRIGEETLAVHAPLAHRMGLGALKAELEDRAFAVAAPEEYSRMAAAITATDSHEKLQQARLILAAHLNAQGISCSVSGRVKHLWSAHRKAARLRTEPGNLPDLLGLRVICADEETCQEVLGAVHNLWKPDLARLRDYVNRPKPNGYQSLHTTVTGPEGRLLEVQVRTQSMHDAAEHGAASHHAYKHGHEPAWVNRLLEWSNEDLTDEEYLEGVHDELGVRKQILTLTPRGQVIELPEGACPVDFAYAVHSAIGDRCVGAKIDGRMVSLDTRLKNGQMVEILTGQRNGPALEWLEWVRTSKARSRIRAHTNREQARAATPVTKTSPGRPRRTTTHTVTPPANARIPRTPWLDDLALSIAGCCTPKPGELVAGIVGRGEIRVHRSDCEDFTRVATKNPGRHLPVHWVREGHSLESINLQATPRPGLLAELAGAARSVGGTLLTSTTDDTEKTTLLVDTPRSRKRDLRTSLQLVDGVTVTG